MEVITQIQKLMKEQTDSFEKELKDVKEEMKEIQNNLDLAEAGHEEEATLSCKLLEENKKISELVISQTDKLKEVSIKYNEGYKINQELREENEALKERLSIMKATASTHIQDINEVHQDYGDIIREFKKENEALKEKYIQSVKDRIKANPPPPSDLPEKLNKIIEKLKKENEGLKEIIRTEESCIASGILNRFYEVMGEEEQAWIDE